MKLYLDVRECHGLQSLCLFLFLGDGVVVSGESCGPFPGVLIQEDLSTVLSAQSTHLDRQRERRSHLEHIVVERERERDILTNIGKGREGEREGEGDSTGK